MINRRLIEQDQEMREQFPAEAGWDEAIPLFAHSYSLLLTLLTADGHTILVHRGRSLGCRPNVFDVSLAEGLGLHTPTDFSASDRQFLSFAVDTELCMWGLFGTVKLQRLVKEVLENLRRSVRDRFESRRVFSVPFTPEEVCSCVFSHKPFSPSGFVCLYHALVHEFGNEQVNTVISSY